MSTQFALSIVFSVADNQEVVNSQPGTKHVCDIWASHPERDVREKTAAMLIWSTVWTLE